MRGLSDLTTSLWHSIICIVYGFANGWLKCTGTGNKTIIQKLKECLVHCNIVKYLFWTDRLSVIVATLCVYGCNKTSTKFKEKSINKANSNKQCIFISLFFCTDRLSIPT